MTTRHLLPCSARPGARACALALACLLAAAAPARSGDGPARVPAAPRVSSGSSSDGWGTRRVVSHFRTRTGVVHLCILAIVAALYVMMRKLTDAGPSRPCAGRGEGRDGNRYLDGGAP